MAYAFDRQLLTEETMETRLLGALVGLAISFALPAFAQHKLDPQITEKVNAKIRLLTKRQ